MQDHSLLSYSFKRFGFYTIFSNFDLAYNAQIYTGPLKVYIILLRLYNHLS